MTGNYRRYCRAGLGLLAAAAVLVLACAGLAWAEAQAEGTRYPAGQEWMAGPPPLGVQVALVKTSDVAVGLVLAEGVQQGQTVSGTIVALTPKGSDLSAAEGMVLVDPAGKEHPVEPGKLITFTVGAAAAIPVLKGGNTIGAREIPLGPVETLPNGPIIAQSDRTINIPGSFDGDAANTTARLGDTPLKVIAESPDHLVVASPNLGETTGPMEIEIEDGGKQTAAPANAVQLNLQAPTNLRLGQRTQVEVMLTGLQGLQGIKKTELNLYAYLVNETPQNIRLDKKVKTLHLWIDPKKIGKDGVYRLRVPLTAVAPGAFRLVGSVLSNTYRCKITCTGCTDGWTCGDNGNVDCSGGLCSGACGKHAGGAACDHSWTCDCKFRKCSCD